MLSEEEKEAIKVLKDLLEEFEDVEKWVIVNFSKKEFESLRICVNLIEKQQKEIEDLKEKHKTTKQMNKNLIEVVKDSISKDKIYEIISDMENNMDIYEKLLKLVENDEKQRNK